MILGPIIGQVMASDLCLAGGDHGVVATMFPRWLRCFCLAVANAGLGLSGRAYGGLAAKIRTFEHQAHEQAGGRSVIIADH